MDINNPFCKFFIYMSENSDEKFRERIININDDNFINQH